MALWLGVLAGALQALGYVLYIGFSLRKEVNPNPTTWLMFAYGVGLLTVLELDRGAEDVLLYLPVACATFSVFVAGICWWRGTLRWSNEWENSVAFIADLTLTAGYLGVWWFMRKGILSESERMLATLAFLIGSNLTIFTSFAPLLRDVIHDPTYERALPWFVWSVAYAVLGVATGVEHGFYNEFMLYPIISSVLHGYISWLVRPFRRRKY